MSGNIQQPVMQSNLSSKKRRVWLKWGVVALACAYLFHKLFSFEGYNSLWAHWQGISYVQWGWLVAVIALLPVNWWLEAEKWRLLTAHVEQLRLTTAFRAVLAGITTGFVTPNRVGEMAGRMMFLSEGNRRAGATLSLVNSLTQNLVMALVGLPAAVYFFFLRPDGPAYKFQVFFPAFAVAVLLFLGLYFLMPRLAGLKTGDRMRSFTACLAGFSPVVLCRVIGVSLLRYLVFCIQFFMMLQFFGVQLQPAEALVAIPANYLFVTLFPTFAFSEAAVRSSSAVFFIGAFSAQLAGIALAGMSIWLVNFVVPLLAGIAVLARK